MKTTQLKIESDWVLVENLERLEFIFYRFKSFVLKQILYLFRKSKIYFQESPRAPTPDTESEQPTDTELSESKTGSPETLEQRTPTPETEAEMDETEVTDSTLDTGSINATETLVS